MKKTLIALAAVAATGAAMAQSTVTLYGVADIYFGTLEDQMASAAITPKQTGLNPGSNTNGGLSTSRWGLRGTEDLGGGLKANFNVEQGFNIDTGNSRGANGVQFDREAWVGLSGGFGEVRLGRTYTVYDQIRGGLNANANSNMSITGSVFDSNVGVGGVTTNDDNQIRYNSPSFNGFTFGVTHSFGEDKTTTNGASSVTQVSLRYADGPLAVGFANSNEKTKGTTPAADKKYNFLGASYDFGVAAVTAGIENAKQANRKDNSYLLGVSVPMGAVTVFLGYADSETKQSGVEDGSASGYALHATYALSKRTTVYGGIRDVKEKTSGAADKKLEQIAVGLRHTF